MAVGLVTKSVEWQLERMGYKLVRCKGKQRYGIAPLPTAKVVPLRPLQPTERFGTLKEIQSWLDGQAIAQLKAEGAFVERLISDRMPKDHYGCSAEVQDGKWVITNLKLKPDPRNRCQCGSQQVWTKCDRGTALCLTDLIGRRS